METVTVSQTVDAPESAVRDIILDIEPFMLAAGFDTVQVDEPEITIAKAVGIATIELELELFERQDAVLAYEQRDGMFESMQTEYTVDPIDTGVEVTARTTFELPVPLIGGVLDSTVVTHQRTQELEAQLEYIQSTVGDQEE